MTEPLFTVWATTDGTPCSPILCTTGDLATTFAVDLGAKRLAHDVILVLCCQANGGACTRDTMYEPGELDRPTEVLMRAAMARGITWPADLGQPEPEYSVLFDD